MSRCRRIGRTAKRAHARSRARSGGLSLIELLIVISLLSIFIAAVYESVIVGLRVVSAADSRETLRQQLAVALDRLTRDISVANDVDAAQNGRFQFDTPDVNTVDYVYSGSSLSRDDAASSQVTILNNISSFDFNYFDSAGTQLSEPVSGPLEDTIRLVQILITVTKNNETLTLASAVYLRSI